MDDNTKSLKDKSFQDVFVQNLCRPVCRTIKETVALERHISEPRVKMQYTPAKFLDRIRFLYQQVMKDKDANSSLNNRRKSRSSNPSSRSNLSSRRAPDAFSRNLKSQKPVSINSLSAPSHSQDNMATSIQRLFLLDTSHIQDQDLVVGINAVKSAILQIREDYNKIDSQKCVICGEAHRFDNCHVLKSDIPIEIAKKVFIFFSNLSRMAKQKKIVDLNVLKELNQEDLIRFGTNQVSTDVASNPLALNSVAINPFGLNSVSNNHLGLNSVSNDNLGLNSISSFLPVGNTTLSPTITGIHQLYNQPTANNQVSDESSFNSSLSSLQLWTGINSVVGDYRTDNLTISSQGTNISGSTDSSADFCPAGK